MLMDALTYLWLGASILMSLSAIVWNVRRAYRPAPAGGPARAQRDALLNTLVMLLVLVAAVSLLLASIMTSPGQVFARTNDWRWLIEFGPFVVGFWLLSLRTPPPGVPPPPWNGGGLHDDPRRFVVGVGLGIGMLFPPVGGLVLIPAGPFRAIVLLCWMGWVVATVVLLIREKRRWRTLLRQQQELAPTPVSRWSPLEQGWFAGTGLSVIVLVMLSPVLSRAL